MNTIKLLQISSLVVCVFFVLIPTGALVLGSLWSGQPAAEGHLTDRNWLKVFGMTIPATLLNQLVSTSVYAIGSSIISVTLGVVMAYFIARTNVPLRSQFENFVLAPRAYPLVVAALAWTFLASPKIGLLNSFAEAIIGFPVLNVYSFFGMIGVFVLYEVPVVFLVALHAFRLTDPSLEEQARICGSSVLHGFFRITLPVLRPLVLSLLVLMFSLSLIVTDIQVIIGIPSNIFTFGASIFWLLEAGDVASDYNAAAALSIIILVYTLVFMVLYRKYVSEAERYVTVKGMGLRDDSSLPINDIGKWRYPALAFLLLYFLISMVLPALILVLLSVTQYVTRPSLDVLTILTAQHWVDVFKLPLFQRALVNSLLLAVAGATAAVFLGLVIGYISYRTTGKLTAILENIAMLPLGFPGLVFATAYIWLFIRTPIYYTLWILLFFYIFAYLPFVLRILTPYLFQLHKELEEASWMSGEGRLGTIIRIILPIIRRGIIIVWVSTFQILLREFSGSILLFGFGTEVLSVALYNYGIQQGLIANAAVVGTTMLLISMGTLGLTQFALRGLKRSSPLSLV